MNELWKAGDHAHICGQILTMVKLIYMAVLTRAWQPILRA